MWRVPLGMPCTTLHTWYLSIRDIYSNYLFKISIQDIYLNYAPYICPYAYQSDTRHAYEPYIISIQVIYVGMRIKVVNVIYLSHEWYLCKSYMPYMSVCVSKWYASYMSVCVSKWYTSYIWAIHDIYASHTPYICPYAYQSDTRHTCPYANQNDRRDSW